MYIGDKNLQLVFISENKLAWNMLKIWKCFFIFRYCLFTRYKAHLSTKRIFLTEMILSLKVKSEIYAYILI